MWFGPEDGQGHIVLQQKSPRRDPSGHFRKNADLLPHFNTQHYNAYKSDTAAEYDAFIAPHPHHSLFFAGLACSTLRRDEPSTSFAALSTPRSKER